MAGCDDGSVVVLDDRDAVTRLGKVMGQPVHMVALETPAAAMAVVATDRGGVTWFRVEE